MTDLTNATAHTERRVPQALSPSALKKFKDNPEEYYTHYITPVPPPPFIQTPPMSVGSAFDAKVKGYISGKLGYGDEKEIFEHYFETGVEEANRDFALPAGERCFNVYKETGALASLILVIERADGKVIMEESLSVAYLEDGTSVKLPNDRSAWGESLAGVKSKVVLALSGKPDLLFSIGGTYVILDWKVNGYCGKRMTSPKPGYIKCWNEDSRIKPKAHKRAHVQVFDRQCCPVDVNIDIGTTLPYDWDLQTSTYYWLIRGKAPQVSDPRYIKIIDQICGGGEVNNMRVARHAYRGEASTDMVFWNDYLDLWNRIAEGNVLSSELASSLDLQCGAYIKEGSARESEVKDAYSALGLDPEKMVNRVNEDHYNIRTQR